MAVLPVEQMLGLPADAKAGALWQADGDLGYLHFTADGLNGIAFDSPRLDLSRGLTVEASLILDAQSIDGKPICVYELSTFEDEDRIVCAIAPGGLPVLHLRWDGKSRTADSATLPKCELTDGKQHRVTWTLSGSGNVATWIDGNIVHYEQTDWSAGVRVFEGHRLGTPQPAQTHSDIEGATMYRSDPRQTFADFTGRLYRFTAWNNYLPDTDGNGEERPGSDPTWERGLVTVQSRRRYLQAGRLDLKEPPVTLFPLDMDAGLNIETTLELAHAELTHSHAEMVAAEAHAARLKRDALDQAKIKLAAAHNELTDKQKDADAKVAQARTERERKLDQARTSRAGADQTAQEKMKRSEEQAEANKKAGKQQADGIRQKAAADKQDKIKDANRRLSRARG